MSIAASSRFTGPLVATAGQTVFSASWPRLGLAVEVSRTRGGVASAVAASIADNDGGFSVTIDPCASGDLITIAGVATIERKGNYEPLAQLRAESMNQEANTLTAFSQELRRDVGRAALVPLGEAGLNLPAAPLRAGKAFGFDDDGHAVAVDYPADLLADAEAAAATAADKADLANSASASAIAASLTSAMWAGQASLYDGLWVDDIGALAANVSLVYVAAAGKILVAAGNYIRTKKEFFCYRVAAAAATDAHVVTAGGIKLYVEANPNFDTRAFWCVTDGVTNTSAQLKRFYDACIAQKVTGWVAAGEYLITPGALFFDNFGADKAWPTITTAGHAAVSYKFSNVPAPSTAVPIDAPMITITNGQAGSGHAGGGWTGGDGNYWMGGYHGGVNFKDTAGAGTCTNRHGFSLQGWINGELGHIKLDGNNNGATIYLPEALFNSSTLEFNASTSTNPDPCACTLMKVEAIEANYASFALLNKNYVGMDSWTVDYVRAIGCAQGVVYGCGQGCVFEKASLGSNAGWAFDDGCHVSAKGGAPNRVVIKGWEIDDSQYGFRINRMAQFVIYNVRFEHRYNASWNIRNTGEGYWPRTCFQFASGTSGTVVSGQISNVIHRVEAIEAGLVNPAGKGGGPAYGVAALGTLIATTNPGSVVNVTYDHQYLDNAALGAVAQNLITGWNANSYAKFSNRGIPFYNSMPGNMASASYSGTAPTIAAGGFGAAGSILALNSERADKGNNYDPTTFAYIAPYSGRCEVSLRLETTAASGIRLRIGAMKQAAAGGAYGIVASQTRYKNGAATESFDMPATGFDVTAGDKVFAIADNNSGVTIALTPSISAVNSCLVTFKMVGE